MLYSYGLVINIKAIINYGYKKFSQILVCSLFGLGLSASKAISHDNVLVIHSYSSKLSSVEQQYAANPCSIAAYCCSTEDNFEL